MDAETTQPKNKVYIRGGYSRVTIQSCTNQVVKKMSIYHSTGCLSFNAIVDAIFSKAVAHFDHTPFVYNIRTDAKYLYIRMPFLGSSLHALPHEDRRPYAIQILGDVAKACLDMEEIGIQHTDIKPANILFSEEGETCLIDYNICSIKHVNLKHLWTENLGTWEYASPEICVLNQPTSTSVVWTLGLLLCYLFYEHPLQDYIDDHKLDTSNQKKWVTYLNQLSTENNIGLPLPKELVYILPDDLRILFHESTYWDPLQRISLREFYKRICAQKEYKKRAFVKFPPRYFTMMPKLHPERDEDLDKMYKWCKETEQSYLLCRSVAIYDRIRTSDYAVLHAPACLAISYMLIGNYIHLDDSYLLHLVRMFKIADWDMFLLHIVQVCTDLEWNLYELCADIMLLPHIGCTDDLVLMIDTLFHFQKGAKGQYTMKSLMNQFHDLVTECNHLKE